MGGHRDPRSPSLKPSQSPAPTSDALPLQASPTPTPQPKERWSGQAVLGSWGDGLLQACICLPRTLSASFSPGTPDHKNSFSFTCPRLQPAGTLHVASSPQQGIRTKLKSDPTVLLPFRPISESHRVSLGGPTGVGGCLHAPPCLQPWPELAKTHLSVRAILTKAASLCVELLHQLPASPSPPRSLGCSPRTAPLPAPPEQGGPENFPPLWQAWGPVEGAGEGYAAGSMAGIQRGQWGSMSEGCVHKGLVLKRRSCSSGF